jgi:hypothetical protein
MRGELIDDVRTAVCVGDDITTRNIDFVGKRKRHCIASVRLG